MAFLIFQDGGEFFLNRNKINVSYTRALKLLLFSEVYLAERTRDKFEAFSVRVLIYKKAAIYL